MGSISKAAAMLNRTMRDTLQRDPVSSKNMGFCDVTGCSRIAGYPLSIRPTRSLTFNEESGGV
jgi:hypothetical protein